MGGTSKLLRKISSLCIATRSMLLSRVEPTATERNPKLFKRATHKVCSTDENKCVDVRSVSMVAGELTRGRQAAFLTISYH